MTACFTVDPRPPFRLDLTAWALRRQPHNNIDRWDGTTYRRTIATATAPGKASVIAVRQNRCPGPAPPRGHH